MLNHMLVINSSASGNASVSRMLVGDLVKHLVEEHPEAKLSCRDLDANPIAQLTSATLAGVRGVPKTEAELAARALSDELIAELRAADLIVIGAPMYNFSIPSSLRTWFDHVLRPRVTFAYSAAGPEGLLTNKRAIVIESRGGLYSEGPDKANDFQEPYLRHLLGFLGISEVSFIHAEKVGSGADAREFALSSARKQIVETVARLSSQNPNVRSCTAPGLVGEPA